MRILQSLGREPLQRDTPYTCWHCGARFRNYPGLDTVPAVNLPPTTALLKRMQTCGGQDCQRREDLRLDACVNAIMRGETQVRGDELREPAQPPAAPPASHWSDPAGFWP